MLQYSIIIPTHNRMDKLNNLMCSIEKLKFRPSEVLIIDDASTDSTATLINSNFPHVRYFQMEKEMWTAFTLSYGIAKAKNELVYIIDDDNVVDDSSIEPIIEIFESDHEKNYGVIGPVTCWLKDKDRIMYCGATYNRVTGIPKGLYQNEKYSQIIGSIGTGNHIIQVDGIPNAFMLRREYAILAGLIPRYLSFMHDDGYLIYSIKHKIKKKTCVSLNSRIFHDFESTGRFSDIRLYYSIRNKILFEKELYSKSRALINLLFVIPVVAYYSFIALKQDNKIFLLKILVKAFKDGILSQKLNGLIKWENPYV